MVELDSIIQIAARTAIKVYEEQKDAKRKSHQDRRLRNTKLLLRNYRVLNEHCKDALFSTKVENATEFLEGLPDMESEELYIESIKRSTERTYVIIAHVKAMIEVFRSLCGEDLRKYNIIYDLYINPIEVPTEDLITKYNIDRSNFYRCRNKAIESLTILFFGIDGIGNLG